MEKEREEIRTERRRVSLTASEDVSQSLETEEVGVWICSQHIERAQRAYGGSEETKGSEGE